MPNYQPIDKHQRYVDLDAHRRGKLSISWWPTTKTWMAQRGWPTPYWSWQKVFVEKVLANDENFYDAWHGSSADFYVQTDE